MKTATTKLLLCLGFIITGIICFAQPGNLDASFGVEGKVITSIKGIEDVPNTVAIQADGKIVVGGYSSNDASGSNYDFVLVRYNTDGSLDNSFGINGKVTTDLQGYSDNIAAIAIQADGKIIAAGSSLIGNQSSFALVRYNTDGSLDNSFGIGGKVFTNIAGPSDAATSVALQADGRIVVGGYAHNGDNGDFGIIRYNSDGSVDNSFGVGGAVITPIDLEEMVKSVAIQTDGKIIAAGEGLANGGSNYNFILARYSSAGILDNSFGAGGIVITDVDGNMDFAHSALIQNDGKIVVVGENQGSSGQNFTLVRYNADGSLDNGFGSGGKVITSIRSIHDPGKGGAIQVDGKIIAVGATSNGTNSDFGIIRYNVDGSLDNSFGIGGKVITNFPVNDALAYSVAIQPDGKIVAVGPAYTYNLTDGTVKVSFGVARYNVSPGLPNCASYPCGVNKVTICHKPYGNQQTICVDQSAVAGHLAHGDLCGPCSLLPFNTQSRATAEEQISSGVFFKNFPNPFASNTMIHFMLQENTHVKIDMYDAIGQKLSTLFDGNVNAGKEYVIKVDGKNLSKGIYFYKAVTDKRSYIGKMMFIR